MHESRERMNCPQVYTLIQSTAMSISVCEQNRKVIVKSFKPYVKKICLEENGHVVMMGVFDTVDDTVLVRKAILSVSSVKKREM